MRHIDLFSGIGGFALAARWTWGKQYDNIGHLEVDEYADKVYHRHFPTSKCFGDIREVRWEQGQCDLLTGGFPCQPHSIAGDRKASTDKRDLWSECVRALCEIRPSHALFENVPGLLTSEQGRFFNRVLSDLAGCGYDAEWQTVPACSVGATHSRERVWIVVYPRSEHVDCGEVFTKDSRDFIARWETQEEWSEDRKFLAMASRTIRGLEKSGKGFYAFPDVPRMADGIPAGMDRIKGLGNAIVPQVARVIMEAIKQHECSKHFA